MHIYPPSSSPAPLLSNELIILDNNLLIPTPLRYKCPFSSSTEYSFSIRKTLGLFDGRSDRLRSAYWGRWLLDFLVEKSVLICAYVYIYKKGGGVGASSSVDMI